MRSLVVPAVLMLALACPAVAKHVDLVEQTLANVRASGNTRLIEAMEIMNEGKWLEPTIQIVAQALEEEPELARQLEKGVLPRPLKRKILLAVKDTGDPEFMQAMILVGAMDLLPEALKVVQKTLREVKSSGGRRR